jgi:hypothetical protein
MLMDQFVCLSDENLVNTFLVNALKNKDKQAIQDTLNILLYAYAEDLLWKIEAFYFAIEYNNYDLAIELLKIGAKPDKNEIKIETTEFTSEQKKNLLNLINK